jgi:biopolymer transport protein ExbD
MNFRKSKLGELPTLQMTSMMDIIFLMLLFFITTSVFSQWEYEINITLPTAQSGKVPDRLPGEIIINIAQDGRVSVNQQDLTLDALKARLDRLSRYFPGQPVVLRADKETKYEHLIKVIDTCRKADIWNFSMATNEEKKGVATETK